VDPPGPSPQVSAEPALDPLVSVVVICYNQQEFIGQALQSILDQEIDWPMEVIVADDASTDATPEIIREFDNRHPGRIRPLLRPENVGIHANAMDALNNTQGKYVALCEGDDFWTDPEKLRRQISHLEEHPDVSICFHPVLCRWDDHSRPDSIEPPAADHRDLSLDALLEENFMATNSVVYRRLPSYDDIPDVLPLDWFLHIRHARRGQISMLPQVMAVYRRHPGGLWYSSRDHPERFWQTMGVPHVAFVEALIDDFRDDPERQHLIARLATEVLKPLLVHGLADADPSLVLRLLGAHPAWAKIALGKLLEDLNGQSAELAALRTALTDLRAESLAQQAEIVELQAVRDRADRLDAKVGSLRNRLDRERMKVKRLRAKADRADRRIEQILQSRTWRIGRMFVVPVALARRRSK
jgi:glycosyltransferase involved in cell wall biosynthesis